ncbi:hypothetical protein [Rhodococcus qingshengii]|uniref:hypothetical protein n=1 Tax=Rhodococcus qingshengii TaxID=334542 RepID=UPI0036DBE82D
MSIGQHPSPVLGSTWGADAHTDSPLGHANMQFGEREDPRQRESVDNRVRVGNPSRLV